MLASASIFRLDGRVVPAPRHARLRPSAWRAFSLSKHRKFLNTLDEVAIVQSFDFANFAKKSIAKMEKIIGREFELGLLSKYYSTDRPEFIALYGRRRVGKTFRQG